MARPLRLEFPGALYHLTARGNARARIYIDDQDRIDFLDLLGETCECFNWRSHGYCLMDNHYHAEDNMKRDVSLQDLTPFFRCSKWM